MVTFVTPEFVSVIYPNPLVLLHGFKGSAIQRKEVPVKDVRRYEGSVESLRPFEDKLLVALQAIRKERAQQVKAPREEADDDVDDAELPVLAMPTPLLEGLPETAVTAKTATEEDDVVDDGELPVVAMPEPMLVGPPELAKEADDVVDNRELPVLPMPTPMLAVMPEPAVPDATATELPQAPCTPPVRAAMVVCSPSPTLPTPNSPRTPARSNQQVVLEPSPPKREEPVFVEQRLDLPTKEKQKFGAKRLALFTKMVASAFCELQGQESPKRLSKRSLEAKLEAEFSPSETVQGLAALDERNKIMIYDDLVLRI